MMPWCPRAATQQRLRLLRTQKELHRTRNELARRTESQREKQAREDEGKPDWTLALRYRLTANFGRVLTLLQEW